MLFRQFLLKFSGLVIAWTLTACAAQPTVTPTPDLETATPTETPKRTLTVCLGAEPDSLYPVNNPSSAARSVLSALYDGPIDVVSYEYQPVILEQIPAIENGDAQLFQTSVYVGDEIVDANGLPVTLTVGTIIRPAGCRSDECEIVYDGTSEVLLDQMQVTFRLLPGLTWSDGEPLTANDSVFTFNLDASPSTPGSNYLTDRTKSYEAADDQTVQWWGKPGFVDPTYFTNFWMPLPEHLWGQIPADEVADEVGRTPIGWGPYVLQEWVDGDHITLQKNPRYFRSDEDLPIFDTIIFRFTPDSETAIASLLAGTCDILDPSVHLEGDASLLASMDEQGQLQSFVTQTPVMEQLAIGIVPATYDEFYNPQYDRVDFFGDVRVRKALALCLDRQQVVDRVLGGLTSVPAAYLPEEHPLYSGSVTVYSHDVAAGSALLTEAGWLDLDGDPSTPRVARGVMRVPDDTLFSITYLTTSALQRQQTADVLAASLEQCGIQVNVQYLDQNEFYASGPQGLLFGRQFDLAAFAMGSTGVETSCEWFTSSEVPNDANVWVGTNVGGYANPAFDAVCRTALQSFPDETSHADAYAQAQSIFADELPVIPLYWRLKVAAARTGLCGLSLDPTMTGLLWNIEVMDDCLP